MGTVAVAGIAAPILEEEQKAPSHVPPLKSADYALSCGWPQMTEYCRYSQRTRCDGVGQIWTASWIECGDHVCRCISYRDCNNGCREVLGDAYDDTKKYEAAYDVDGNLVDVRVVGERGNEQD